MVIYIYIICLHIYNVIVGKSRYLWILVNLMRRDGDTTEVKNVDYYRHATAIVFIFFFISLNLMHSEFFSFLYYTRSSASCIYIS